MILADVWPHHPQPLIEPPDPGERVLACRCGSVLALADMRTVDAGLFGNGCPRLGRITCEACANPTHPAGKDSPMTDTNTGGN